MDRNTMYTLGMICRAIWPGKDRKGLDNPPASIIEVITTRPASGLALMIKHPANTADKQEAIADLVDKLSDISDPPGGIKAEDQGPFWIGYYHYASAMSHAAKYGPDELAKAGHALFGDRWQTDLSRALNLSDARRIRQWMAGERPIPVGVWADICGLLRHRQMSIQSVLNEIAQEG
jgi:hypothetical protein